MSLANREKGSIAQPDSVMLNVMMIDVRREREEANESVTQVLAAMIQHCLNESSIGGTRTLGRRRVVRTSRGEDNSEAF